MRFSEQFRAELWAEDPPKNSCCRRALVYGILFCAEISGGMIRFSAPDLQIAGEMETLFSTVLHTKIQIEPQNSGGHIFGKVTLISDRASGVLQRVLMSDLPIEKTLGFDCEHCMHYFLRGVFMTAGSMVDPGKQYHLEVACPDASTAAHLLHALDGIGCPAKTIKRKNGTHLYYKNSEGIEDLLSYLNARKSLFTLINHKIENDIRNNENRATNCDTQNIRKAVLAASSQVAAIRSLRESEAWNKIPEPLRKTAELRLEHENATLGELMLLHQPPISKSGLNHRLQKLVEFSKNDSLAENESNG